MSASVRLTEQQQAIVAHDHGPALVFAVAGAGKTTAMVHRIERLVRERVFAPEQILATSFAKVNALDIRHALAPWPYCARVQASTLHSFGYWIIGVAQRQGYLTRAQFDDQDTHGLDKRILNEARRAARRDGAAYARELSDFDEQDFLDYVGACKGNLAYADLAAARLPRAAQEIATQAAAPEGLSWYLDFYRLFEQVRLRDGRITFDDMLMTGWELLVRHEGLLDGVRRRYRCVLVDEFQDINLAQSEILDLITLPHRDYMVIGDDDQTIYEWRGAHPEFILDFEKRYGARKYIIDDCFRCQASQVVLANRVIEHNTVRERKRLSLTRGFNGETNLYLVAGYDRLAAHLVGEIQALVDGGMAPSDIAILVRVYAQTPYIEQALIERGLPYKIVGNAPFYARDEVVTLLEYTTLARLERKLQAGERLTPGELREFASAWSRVYRVPTRYLTRELSEQIAANVAQSGAPLGRILRSAAAALPSLARGLNELADDLDWLTLVVETEPAHSVLRRLDARLEYQEYLRQRSGGEETGAGKAASVAAFIDYTRGKGTLRELRAHLDHLAREAAEREVKGDRQIMLTTIFQAKGKEWPAVFVPHCNAGTIPFGEPEREEEERRLLYVAITRARLSLYLYALADLPLSPFLNEARVKATLKEVKGLADALAQDVEVWPAAEAGVVATLPRRLGLERYFRQWWDAPEPIKSRIAQRVQWFLATATRHEAEALLGITPEDHALWNAIAPPDPAQAAVDYPGFNEWLAQRRARSQPAPGDTRARATRTTKTSSPPPTAKTVKPSPPTPALKTVKAPPPAPTAPKLPIGARVQHPRYGTGTLRHVGGGLATVEFAVGLKDVPLQKLELVGS